MLTRIEPKSYANLKKAEHLIRELCKVYHPDMTEEDISKFFNSLTNDSEIADQALTIWNTAIMEQESKLERPNHHDVRTGDSLQTGRV